MLTLLDGLAGKAGYYVAKMNEPASVRLLGNITVIDSGIPSDTFNCVVSRGPEGAGDADGTAAIAEICASFNEAKLPAAWWTCDGLRPEAVARELAKYHFHRRRNRCRDARRPGVHPAGETTRGFPGAEGEHQGGRAGARPVARRAGGR